MQVCGAGRGAVAATAMPHVRRRARRPREARRRRGAPARARARAGRTGPSCARAGAGRGAAAAPARLRRATRRCMHHARAGQRAAPRSGGAGLAGGGRRHQAARLQTADAGKCRVLVSTTRCDVAWGSASSNSIMGSSSVRRRGRVLGAGEDRCGGLGRRPPGLGHSPRAPAGRTRTRDTLEPSYAATEDAGRVLARASGLCSRRAERRSLKT